MGMKIFKLESYKQHIKKSAPSAASFKRRDNLFCVCFILYRLEDFSPVDTNENI